MSLSIVFSNSIYKAILRSGIGNQRIIVLESQVNKSWWRKLLSIPPSTSQLLSFLNPEFLNFNFKLVKNIQLRSDLLNMEEIQIIKSYKFGILYLSQGQTTESQSLSNMHGILFILILFRKF